MKCRSGTLNEFKELWNYSDSNTYNYFRDGIINENITFLTIKDEGQNVLVGELYIFWSSEDNQEANGVSRAYLCALRVREEYRGKGLASLLINEAKRLAQEKGFTELTIGIDNENYQKLLSMYNKWGFEKLVKRTFTDFHYIDENNNPVKYDESFDIRMCII